MRTRVALLAAALLALWVAERAPALTSGDGVWPSPLDFGSSWITSPHDRSSGGVQLWTRERIAAMDGAIVTVGDDEQTLNLPSAHEIPGIISSSFDLNFTTSSVQKSTDNLLLYMADVRARVPAGHDGPLFFYDTRPDLILRHEADGTGVWAPESDWFLRTDRLIANFTGWFDGLGSQWSWCRSPNLSGDATEAWDAAEGGTGCNRTFLSVADGEYGARLYDLIEGVVPGLGDDVAYYVARPDSASQGAYYPYAALANMLDPEYQDAVVDRCAQAVALGWDGCYLPHKNSFYWNNDGTDATTRGVEHWIDVGDGLGGYSSSAGTSGCTITGTLDTLAELFACETLSSGPPELPDGTPFLWDEYALGQVEIARKLNAAGVPYFRLVNPYWYEGCDWGPDHAGAQMPGTWSDASCANEWDDPGTANNEAAFLREIVQRAAFVEIDLGGKPTGSESIGSGGGSGFSFADLKWILEHPASGPVPRVLGFYNPGATNGAYATPPKLGTDPSEDNPMTERLVASAPALTAAFVASPVQGATCVAPCVVHLDALGTTSPVTTRPFHEIDYQWDCGSPFEGLYVGTGWDKNKPRGPVSGCPYDSPGTYTITLTTRDSAGSVDQATQTVTVSDPLTTFGSRLFCARSAATGDFLGCPLDTNDDGVCDQHAANCFTQSSAATAFNTTANVDSTGGTKGALYLRRGDSFTSLGSITGATGSGPALLGAFGNGPKPVVSGVTQIAGNPGWTFAGFEGVAANPDTAEFFAYGAAKAGITVYDVYVHGGANCAGTSNGGAVFNDLLAFVDSECDVDPTGTWSSGGGGSNLFVRSDRFLLLGNRINGGRTREFNLRTTHSFKTAIQYNRLENPDEARNNVQIRAWATVSGSEPAPAIDQYVVISDNVLKMPANATASMVIRITQDNLAGNPSTGTPLGTYDHLIERNFFQFQTDATIAGLANGLVQAEGGRITVRNNVLDLRGPMTSGSVLGFFRQAANIGGCESCVNDTNVVQGNVLFHDQDYNQDVDFCASASGTTGHVCEGNLVYRPLDATVGTVDVGNSGGDDWVIGGGWTQSGNYRTGTNPFATAIPAHDVTTIESFQLSASSAARNVLATPTKPFLADAGGRFRPASSSYDAGAWEEGAVGHPFAENLIGVNSEKMEYDEEAILFADAINNSAQWRTLANPETSAWESFFQSFEEDRTTSSAVSIPVNQLGWPSVDLPYDPDGVGGNDPVVARMELMKQDAPYLNLTAQTIDIEAVSGSTFDLDDTDASNDAFASVIVGQKILLSGFATNGTVTATITAKASNGQVTATGARSTGAAATAEVGSGISVVGNRRPIAYPRGTYTLRFDGTGTVIVGGDAAATTCTGTDASCTVFVEPTTAGVDLFITSSDAESDPITNVDLLLPGYTDEHQFYEPFVEKVRAFGFLRTLNLIQVNHYPCSNLEHATGNSALTTCTHTWAGRTDPEGIQATRRGVAWEHIIALANEARVGLWITIPHAATDEYVTELGTLLRDNFWGWVIDELSNETWNGTFEQELYFQRLGAEQGWGTGTGGNTPNQAAQQRAYVNRSAEVGELLDDVFTGADAARLRHVIGSFAFSTAETTALIAAMQSATYNPTGFQWDAIAIAPYIAGTLGGSVDTVAELVADTAADLASKITTYVEPQFALIDAAGLEMWAYEGGLLMTASDAVTVAALDDPGMRAICEDVSTDWFAAGGTLGSQAFLVRDFQGGGMWRSLDQSLSRAPRAQGYADAIRSLGTTLP